MMPTYGFTMLMSGRLIYKLASRSRGRRALPVHHLVRTPYEKLPSWTTGYVKRGVN